MKQRIIAILLALFLGTLGVHAFYLNDKKHGQTLLILTLVGWFTSFLLIGFIPLVVTAVWAFVDFVKLCLMSDREFERKYTCPEEIIDISE